MKCFLGVVVVILFVASLSISLKLFSSPPLQITVFQVQSVPILLQNVLLFQPTVQLQVLQNFGNI